jgi:hypothetical protein
LKRSAEHNEQRKAVIFSIRSTLNFYINRAGATFRSNVGAFLRVPGTSGTGYAQIADGTPPQLRRKQGSWHNNGPSDDG